MNNLPRLDQAIDSRLRGPAFSRFLKHFGIDPRRYWLLMDLFSKLSDRQEMQGELGRQNHALKLSGGMLLVLSVAGSVVFVVLGLPVAVLFAMYLGFTAFILLGILLSEAANSLVNPVEGLVLAHQPINGATYTGAKLSHLVRIVLVYVAALNGVPAIAGVLLKDAPWFYPLLHLSAALTTGMLLAFFCCAIFGLLFRFVPVRRLKGVGQLVQGIPFVLFFMPRPWISAVVSRASDWLTQGPLQVVPLWALGLMLIGAIVLLIGFGLRALSGDYMIRVSGIAHGRSNARTKNRRSFTGEIVQRLFGGQVSRAGFDYMRRMMLRDWQFRRQLLGTIPIVFFMIVGIVGAQHPSPFAGRFSMVHFLPHALGLLFFAICAFLPYGNDYKGVWLFSLIPDRTFDRFVRGVHAALWLWFVLTPHVLLLALFCWRWGVADSALFIPYSAAVATVYLAAALRQIDGIPFGKQVNPARMAAMQGGMIFFLIGFLFVAGISVGMQYLVFHSRVAVVILTGLVGGAAYLLTRRSLMHFQSAIRFSLTVESTASRLVYTEVETL